LFVIPDDKHTKISLEVPDIHAIRKDMLRGSKDYGLRKQDLPLLG